MLKKANKETLASAKQLRELVPMLNDEGLEILMLTAALVNTPRYLKKSEDIRVAQKKDDERPTIVPLEGTALPVRPTTERLQAVWDALAMPPQKPIFKRRLQDASATEIHRINLDRYFTDWIKSYRQAS